MDPRFGYFLVFCEYATEYSTSRDQCLLFICDFLKNDYQIVIMNVIEVKILPIYK